MDKKTFTEIREELKHAYLNTSYVQSATLLPGNQIVATRGVTNPQEVNRSTYSVQYTLDQENNTLKRGLFNSLRNPKILSEQYN